jgi:hypothetical protein
MIWSSNRRESRVGSWAVRNFAGGGPNEAVVRVNQWIADSYTNQEDRKGSEDAMSEPWESSKVECGGDLGSQD